MYLNIHNVLLRPLPSILEGSHYCQGCPKYLTVLTFSFPSRVRERLKPEFLVSALMALMAPDFTSCLACSVAVAVSTTGCSDSAGMEEREEGGVMLAVEGSPLCSPLDSPSPSLTAFDPALARCATAALLLQSQQGLFLGRRESVRRAVCQPRHWSLRCTIPETGRMVPYP